MRLKPRLLRRMEDIGVVEKLMHDFYANRPDTYAIKKRGDHLFNRYIDLAQTYTPKDGALLEVGAGAGYAALEISKRGIDVIGCDIFPKYAYGKNTQRISNGRVRFVSYNGLHLPFRGESFETVASFCVFEHIINVNGILKEIDRVLKPKGIIIIKSPNWSSFNVPLRAIESLIFKKSGYWQYEELMSAFLGLVRPIFWYYRALFGAGEKTFILTYPKIRGGRVCFEHSDDDCVHLCQPLSFKKWLKKNSYSILEYNKFEGESMAAKVFNTVFPSFATTNTIIARKC